MNGLRQTLGPLTLATGYASLPLWTYIFNALALEFVDLFTARRSTDNLFNLQIHLDYQMIVFHYHLPPYPTVFHLQKL